MRASPERGHIALTEDGKALEFPFELDAAAETLAGPVKLRARWGEPSAHAQRRLEIWLQADAAVALQRLDLKIPFRFPNGSSLLCREFHTTGLAKDYALADILNHKPGLWQRLRRRAHEGVLSYAFAFVSEAEDTITGWSGLSDDTGFLEAELRPRSEEVILRHRLQGLQPGDEPVCILNLDIFTGSSPAELRQYFASFRTKNGYPPAVRNLNMTDARAQEANGFDQLLKQDLQKLEKAHFPATPYLLDLKWPVDRLLQWQPQQKEMTLREDNLALLSAMVRRLKGRGYTAGLSLSPLLLGSRANWPQLPEGWELPARKDREQASGEQPQSRQVLLNPANQALLSYILKGLQRLPAETDLNFFRLEGLSHCERAAAQGQTAAQVTARVLQGMNKAFAPAACGFGKLPYQLAVRHAQPFRVGPLFSNRWEMTEPKQEHQRLAVGTQATLKSLLNHLYYGLTGTFHYGPGFSLRPKSERFPLNEDEKFTLFLVNLLSDWIIEFRDDFSELTTLAQQTLLAALPHRTPRILAFDKRGDFYQLVLKLERYEYHAFLNLGERQQQFHLPSGGTFFDTLSCGWHDGGQPFNLGPHDSRLYLKVLDEPHTICGSLGHVLPGQEVVRIEAAEPDEITLTLHPLSIQQSHIYLRIPDELMGARVNGLFYRQMQRHNINMLVIDGINCPREWPQAQVASSL